MSQRACIFLLLISGWASLSPAQVASPKFEVGPGPYNLDLDAESGKYEERFIQVSTDAFTVKGFIQFADVRKNAKWEPLAAVEVMGPKNSFAAGLIVFVTNPPDKIQFAVRDQRLEGLPDATFARAPLTDKLIPFELRLDRSGWLQVSVAGTSGMVVKIRPIEITRVRVLASTGHVRFSKIEISGSDR